MKWMVANDVVAAGVEEPQSPSSLLGRIDVPVAGAELTLASGRRYELASGPEGDRLTVRGRNGAVLLHVRMTDAGPVLSFTGADIEIAAARRLALSADDVSIEARRSMETHVEGDATHTVAGTRHTRVRGPDRLEAASVHLQANEGAVELRAVGTIAIDGQHIGLNDDPCPEPFGWSALAGGPEKGV